MELDLENIIRQEILDNFHHKYLVSKEYVNVEISDSSILADITINNVDFLCDPNGYNYEKIIKNDINYKNLDFIEYKKQEEEKEALYIQSLKLFINNILIKHGLDVEKYDIGYINL